LPPAAGRVNGCAGGIATPSNVPLGKPGHDDVDAPKRRRHRQNRAPREASLSPRRQRRYPGTRRFARVARPEDALGASNMSYDARARPMPARSERLVSGPGTGSRTGEVLETRPRPRIRGLSGLVNAAAGSGRAGRVPRPRPCLRPRPRRLYSRSVPSPPPSRAAIYPQGERSVSPVRSASSRTWPGAAEAEAEKTKNPSRSRAAARGRMKARRHRRYPGPIQLHPSAHSGSNAGRPDAGRLKASSLVIVAPPSRVNSADPPKTRRMYIGEVQYRLRGGGSWRCAQYGACGPGHGGGVEAA